MLKIERFKMILLGLAYHVQREENENGVYYEIRNFDTLDIPTHCVAGRKTNREVMQYLQAKAKENYSNQLAYCGVPELVGCFTGAALTRLYPEGK